MLSEHEAHLCPVRAMAAWIDTSRITSGYIFRRRAAGDRVQDKDAAMTSEQFLKSFRNNLIDICVEPSPYGTHSFRRGGCQYFASLRRWKLRRICEWGGWSTEFSSMTIVKYLISWNDEPEESRDNFLDPDLEPSILCHVCKRSCHCAF
ncbi:hypothetical protein CPB84DRAFT_1675966 [Gymnopilus junonius]|uniref:DNA breaking-rejoining enzyme n=1 Tax=Gymnopilus junonius TaxID=109634 RepID=A0A9P5NWK7_GYMJU|nr:hypothetical protein CPB84DRAFT_1675966 [Gymnopilus junonius]